jgi:hypothetical protein
MAIHDRRYSYDDWLTHCAKGPIAGAASRYGDSGFCGTKTFAEAMDLARKGWPEGLAAVKAMAEQIWRVVGQEVKKLEFNYEVAGDDVDVGRFLTGEPENMLEYIEEPSVGRGKIVHIYVNTVASCGISKETMYYRGAAVLALVDALEKLGFSCCVQTIDAISERWTGDKNVLRYNVTLREAGEALDMDRLAFALAHASWLRRLIFSAMEQESPELRKQFSVPNGCYGNPEEARGATNDEHGIDVPSLRYGSHHFQSQETAIKWVLEAAAQVLGRPVEQVA